MSKRKKPLERRPLVVANWKLNGSKVANSELVNALTAAWQGEHRAEVALCPPAIYLPQVTDLLSESAIVCGAQDVSQFSKGAYTGELSATMLADFGCTYAIIGHSERRNYFAETNQQVAEKFIQAQKAGLTPILCVGESLDQRDNNKALEAISHQIEAVISAAGLDAFSDALVAYEPIWAVGTGRIASPEQVEEMHRHIRSLLGAHGESIRLLYGGSVKADNAKPTFALDDVDGALIGGASLIADEFLSICRAADVK